MSLSAIFACPYQEAGRLTAASGSLIVAYNDR